MKINVLNVKSQILTKIPTELLEAFSIFYKDYQYMTKVKENEWDGKYNFISSKTGKFPTGLLEQVKAWCNRNDIEYEIIDNRIRPEISELIIDKNILDNILLEDYQVTAVQKAIEHERGILQLPTGSGKTEIAIAISKVIGLKALYLVHTKDILYQTVDRFKKRTKLDIGIIGDGLLKEGKDVTVAMVQSLYSLSQRDIKEMSRIVNGYDVLIFDECHHASAKTWYMLAMYSHNAYYRFGLSGTPLNNHDLSNLKLIACLGEQIYSLPTTKLQEDGHLSKILIRIIDNTEVVYGKNWQSIYRQGIVESAIRNNYIKKVAEKHYNKNDKILILVREIKHGNYLKSILKVPTVFLTGKESSDIRNKTKEEFMNGKNFILIATSIFDEGVDIPNINILIHGVGGKSDIKTIQRSGRGLRKKENDGKLIVYDFADISQYLVNHSLERIDTYEKTFGKENMEYWKDINDEYTK